MTKLATVLPAPIDPPTPWPHIGNPVFFTSNPPTTQLSGDAYTDGQKAILYSGQRVLNESPVCTDFASYPILVDPSTPWWRLTFRVYWSHGPFNYLQANGGGWPFYLGFGTEPVPSGDELQFAVFPAYTDDPALPHIGLQLEVGPASYPTVAPVGEAAYLHLGADGMHFNYYQPGGISGLSQPLAWTRIDFIDVRIAGGTSVPPLRLNPRHDKRLYPPTRSRGVRPTGYL